MAAVGYWVARAEALPALAAFKASSEPAEILASLEGLLEGGFGIDMVERGVGGQGGEVELLVEWQANGASEGEFIFC